MPKYAEYWYCRERGLCVNCWGVCDDGYARCEPCRAKHHDYRLANGREGNRGYNKLRPVASGGIVPKRGSQYAQPGWRVSVKLGTAEGRRAIARADAAYRRALRRAGRSES